MAKQTVLAMVQDILSDMNDDEVNSITDTLEGLQVAQIIKSTYEELIAGKNWPHLRTLLALTASGDIERPSHMKLPEDIKELEWISYDKKKTGETRIKQDPVQYLDPDAFLRFTNDRDSDDADTKTVTDFSGVKVLIKTDVAPQFWTSFDDINLVFDSFDKVVESTLQSSKTQCMAFILPVFSIIDSHIPNLPAEAFPMLLAEAKSACFARLKEAPDAKSEQQATRQKNWMSRKAWNAAGGIKFPDYGRRGGKGNRAETLNDKRRFRTGFGRDC